MGIFAVRQRMVKRDLNGLAIHLQFHRLGCHGKHASCSRGGDPSVVAGISKNRISVVVIHVGADSSAHVWSERVCRHGVDGGKGISREVALAQPKRCQSRVPSLTALNAT